MTNTRIKQGSCGHVKCSRIFLITTQAGRGTEVNFLPLLLYFYGVSTVFADVPDPGHSSLWMDSWWPILSSSA